MPTGGVIVPAPPSRYQEPLEADGGDDAAVSRRPECENCGATAIAGASAAEPPRPLLRCSRCRAAHFCSRACQRCAWPFHRACCRANDFADAAEARGELKLAAFLRGHGRLAQLRDAEVARLEAASGSGAPGEGAGGGTWRGMTRDEVMDSMYGRALPVPRPPEYGVGAAEAGAATATLAAKASCSSCSSSSPSAWVNASGLVVAPEMGAAGARYAWSQCLSHVDVAVRLPREVARARRARAAERWRAKAEAAGDGDGDDEEGEEERHEQEEDRLRQPRLRGVEGRHVHVELTATTLRVAVVDGPGRRAGPGVVAGGGNDSNDDDEVLLEGVLEAAVKASECTWYIDDDAGIVRLSLLKRCRRGHYDAVPAAGESAAEAEAAGGSARPPRVRTNADTFWRGVVRGAPASMRLPEGSPPPVAYYSSAYEADD